MDLKRRLRRNRTDGWMRNLVRENALSAHDFILPLFILEGDNQKEDIPSMPGVQRLSVDLAVDKAREAAELGIPAIALFPVTPAHQKDAQGSEALNDQNLICRALRAIKGAGIDVGLITDVALDPYTDHGHDGLLKDGEILNDETVEVLCEQAVLQAGAGADVIAPSDMMDGRVGAIREALDEAGYQTVKIMAYTAKFASGFYGPFRDAVGSGGALKGDKKTYQMDPANKLEALREAELDIEEGADVLMVKPGMPYLDIIQYLKDMTDMPMAAYHVSGEYAMLKAAAEKGWLDYDKCILEALMAFKRAGADMILTYAALDAARLLRG